MVSSYIKLHKSGELLQRGEMAKGMLYRCRVCPHVCAVNRFETKTGKCFSGVLPIVSSYGAHKGEEPVISGSRGAGNIFFGNCNLKCIYCQNYEISQNPKEECRNEVTPERLAEIMLEMQEGGCHNIGFVSPSHFVPQIISAVNIAAGKGLEVPLVYNSNGYDSVESLKLLDGIIDIYLPDFKYGKSDYGVEYSKVPDYFNVAKAAISEMYRQTGDDFFTDSEGVLRRGLIVRHLVLPNGLAESEEVFKFIAGELSRKVHMSVMSQYYPTHRAEREILLSRKVSVGEYERVRELLLKYDLEEGWVQEYESSDYYRPAFKASPDNPFEGG
ncbi:MAG: radical SAM protein [Ignavibacteriaceae bacterium]